MDFYSLNYAASANASSKQKNITKNSVEHWLKMAASLMIAQTKIPTTAGTEWGEEPSRISFPIDQQVPMGG
jgi:hypothetical protein